MRFAIAFALLLASCGPSTAPESADPTRESWYARDAARLSDLARQAAAAFGAGQADEASALIEQAQPIEKRLVSVAHPTLPAAEAASDLDDLYGRMLLQNHHYGWARLMFQKNLNRWKHWSPQTEETRRRYQRAAEEIDECDRQMTK
ncbi:MAG TPA: hypothetical protein VKX39_03015 [Bryobacteraceae bacterium]|nr:hypothetical protein [Bryobacteraceae bacterium]